MILYCPIIFKRTIVDISLAIEKYIRIHKDI